MATSFLPQNPSPTAAPEAAIQDFFDVEPIIALETPPESNNELPLHPENEIVAPEIEPSIEPAVQVETTQIKKKPKTVVHPHPSAVYTPPDAITAHIEKIMEEGIADAYQELTTIQKQQFKLKGEETAKQIKVLLQPAKVKVKKIFQLLLEWLKLLPGINRFFLMQEAKIKTDKILALKFQIQ